MTGAPRTTGRRVLVAEDNAVIELLVSEGLEEHGYECAASFARASDALAWLESETPDFAILDLRLRDGVCPELARELARRGVPFVIFTGYPKHSGVLSEFGAAPWIEKPSSVADLVGALAAAGSSEFRTKPLPGLAA